MEAVKGFLSQNARFLSQGNRVPSATFSDQVLVNTIWALASLNAPPEGIADMALIRIQSLFGKTLDNVPADEILAYFNQQDLRNMIGAFAVFDDLP